LSAAITGAAIRLASSPVATRLKRRIQSLLLCRSCHCQDAKLSSGKANLA
jgi:hypothetical protein